jgi:hypothetical protein
MRFFKQWKIFIINFSWEFIKFISTIDDFNVMPFLMFAKNGSTNKTIGKLQWPFGDKFYVTF